MCRKSTIISLGLLLLAINQLEAKPLKVFILAGQSNMEGHAKVKTFPAIAKDPKTADIYKNMVDDKGKPIVFDNVWIAYSHGAPGGKPGGEKSGKLSAGWGAMANPNFTKIGPEYTFGIYMHKMLGEPILLIKTAWGGKSLYNDFRPPSAGDNYLVPPEKMTEEKKNTVGFYYKLMMDYVKKVLQDPKAVCPTYNPEEGYELSGFIWFQGFNDLVGPYPQVKEEEDNDSLKTKKGRKHKTPKDYSEYSRLLACFIRDVRKELKKPDLPFVIGVLGVGGKDENEGKRRFRKAMAAPAQMPEFKGNVVNVFTENYWPSELDPIKEKEMNIKIAAKRKLNKDKKVNPEKYENLNRKERRAAKEKYETEIEEKIKSALSEDEIYLLKNGISNQKYHYYGSAKFHGQIGKAFAEALVELKKSRKK